MQQKNTLPGDGIAPLKYESKAALYLADLLSIQSDLFRVIEFLDQLLCTQNDAVNVALYNASLMAYRRCFTSGVRTRLLATELTFAEGAQEYHQYKIEMASKLVAHSVNAFDQFEIGVVVNNNSVEGITHLQLIRIGDTKEEYLQFRNFVFGILELVLAPKIASAQQNVLEEAKQMSLDKLNDLKPCRMYAPGPDATGKRR